MENKMNSHPIVMISSYTPRLCGIATFCEEAREFIQKAHPDRNVLVISHTDGEGKGVYPIIDMKRGDWWKPVMEKIEQLKPYAIHIEHEYGLYEYCDSRGIGDRNEGLLNLLDGLKEWPVIIEPHTIHGRFTEFEANFVYKMCERVDVVLFKCHYQKWRLDWNFTALGWEIPQNITIIPHGARPDKRWSVEDVPQLRKDLKLENIHHLGKHLVGLIGWIQSNKRWDILTSMWEDIAAEIQEKTGQEWDLLAAGTWRDPAHKEDYEKYKGSVQLLEKKGLAQYYEFVPRGDDYYKMMAICDFIVLPSTDETQSGTLARIISLNKPYITTAPMEGLTAQTLESGGGMLFTTKKMLREQVIEMATNEELRMQLGSKLHKYLEDVVSWEVVAKQYSDAYKVARKAVKSGERAVYPPEF